MPIARKNLLKEPARLLISLTGVGFAAILILVMTGVYFGTINQVTTYIDHTDAELWVMQEGVSQMFRSVSVIPGALQHPLEATEGVASATPILGVPSSFDYEGSTTAYYLVGYDPQAPVGGPWTIREGVAELEAGETILDRVLASKNRISVGDTVQHMGEEFKVVGLSDQTAAVGNFYAFITLEDAARLMRREQAVSFFLIKAESGTDIEGLRSRLQAEFPDVAVLSQEEFSRNSRDIVISMMGRPFYVMIAISILVGIAIVSLTVFSVTMEQLSDFGIVKAIGADNGQLYRLVMEQALTIGVFGYLIGSLLAYGAQFLIRERLGDVNVQISPQLLGVMLLLILVMSIFASLLPVRRIANVDPAVVFQG